MKHKTLSTSTSRIAKHLPEVQLNNMFGRTRMKIERTVYIVTLGTAYVKGFSVAKHFYCKHNDLK